MKINWAIVGSVAAIAFQTVALAATVVGSANATQSTITEIKVDVSYLKRDLERLNNKVFP